MAKNTDDLQTVLDEMQSGEVTASTVAEHQNSDSQDTMRHRARNRAESIALSQFPDQMSCWATLDELVECMAFGGQVRNYYRYGDFTMCEKQSEKLQFCLKNLNVQQPLKKENVQKYYKAQLVEQMQRGSSEDVWEAKK